MLWKIKDLFEIHNRTTFSQLSISQIIEFKWLLEHFSCHTEDHNLKKVQTHFVYLFACK